MSSDVRAHPTTVRMTDTMNPMQRQAFDQANEGIRLGAIGEHPFAVRHWEKASLIADEHLPGEDINFWIKSGFGAALFDAGRYDESIRVSQMARDWCLAHKQPLASLSIARSYLALGQDKDATAYLREIHRLIGDDIFAAFKDSDEVKIHAALLSDDQN
jgi:tetratricopeptide (TPR) repeat protein